MGEEFDERPMETVPTTSTERRNPPMEERLARPTPHESDEPLNHLGMTPVCFRQAKSFIRGGMDRDEQLDYLLHVQQCPDCRGYLDSASIVLLRRDRIREQLGKGGGN
jgi:hypothetical protein